jgi:hypothetical protein
MPHSFTFMEHNGNFYMRIFVALSILWTEELSLDPLYSDT